MSWQQIRAAATAISEECEDNPGYGGRMPVGSALGWVVRVWGFREEVGEMNGTVVGEGVDGMAGTVLVADS